MSEKKITSSELALKIRRDAIEMTHVSGGSHIACILSMADIIAVLYSDILKYDINNPEDSGRDRFILSKGHAGGGLYAALAEVGFFDVSELLTHCADGSRLSGHVSHKDVPGVEFSTGSLGHGACVASGKAMALKKAGSNARVYTVVGDGECDEGSIWETALFANHYRLNNLTLIIDHNKMQSLDYCENTIELGSLAEKFKCFGWDVIEVDGHNHAELKDAFLRPCTDKPRCIVAHTIKGKGVSFMENNILYHYRDPKDEFYDLAVAELEGEK